MNNKIFFSYSFKDEKKVLKVKEYIESIIDDNNNQKYNVFMASDPLHGNVSGRSWNSQEKQEMIKSFLVVFFLSDNSIISSGVSQELDFYFVKMKKNKLKTKFLYITLNESNFAETVFNAIASDIYATDIEIEEIVTRFENLLSFKEFDDSQLYLDIKDIKFKERLNTTLTELYNSFNEIKTETKKSTEKKLIRKTNTPKITQVKDKQEYTISEEILQNQVNNHLIKNIFPVSKPNAKLFSLPYQSLLVNNEVEQAESMEYLNKITDAVNNVLRNTNSISRVQQLKIATSFIKVEISKDPKIAFNKYKTITDEIGLHIGTNSVRFVIDEKNNQLYFEVPRLKAVNFHLKDAITKEYLEAKSPLLIPLGKDADDNIIYEDISKMPHLIVAGNAGSGKTTFLYSLILSLAIKYKYDEVKFIVYDSHGYEYKKLNFLPHFLFDAADTPNELLNRIYWLHQEMENRFSLLENAKTYNIDLYNKQATIKLPHIILIIDDYMDSLSFDSKSGFDELIMKLVQKGRAAGIHVITSTIKTSPDVLKGTLKANMPSRLAFRVTSYVDSMTVLDSSGAEKLTYKGEAIFRSNLNNCRIQIPYVDNDSLNNIFNYQQNKQLEYDEYLYDAAIYAIENNTCSVSLLQRKFNIGFNRASSIINKLEELKIISEYNGSKPRKVLVTKEELQNLIK